MIITAIENFVLFGTVIALASFAVAWLVRQASRRSLWRLHPDTLTRLYTVLIIVPPTLAAWLVAAALLPHWWLGEAQFEAAHTTPLHQLHLLGDLTASVEPALAYATGLFVGAAALFAAWSSLKSYSRVGSVIKRLEMNAAPPPPEQLALIESIAARIGFDVGLVMSDYPFSFLWGFGHSKLVLSSGLLRVLTPEELAGLLEHEAAHHTRRDNSIKLFLSVCSYASIAFPLSRLILKWRCAEVELVCDEVATARTSAPLDIADALVKLRRRTLLTSRCDSYATSAVGSNFVPDDDPSFERRVRRLIAFADAPPDAANAVHLAQTNRRAALFVSGLLTATLLVVTVFAPLAVHTAAESLLEIIS